MDDGSTTTTNGHNMMMTDESTSTTNKMARELQEDGFAKTPLPILSEKTCDEIKQRMHRLFRGDFETGIYPDEWHWREGISRPEVTREMCNVWKSDRTIASVVLSEVIGELVARVMRWDSVRLAQDDLIWKPPASGQSTVGFHQDSAYISTQFIPYENNSVTVWMALDNVTKDTGCLEYAIRSHMWRPIAHHQQSDSSTAEKQQQQEGDGGVDDADSSSVSFHSAKPDNYRLGIPQQHLHETTFESVPVDQGFAIFHHQDVWHGSGPNQSTTQHRRALVGHYLRGDVQFKPNDSKKESGGSTPWGSTSYIYGRYKRHESQDVDENFFPIIYASPSSGQKRTPWLDTYIDKNTLRVQGASK